jgi:hypothetical protein
MRTITGAPDERATPPHHHSRRRVLPGTVNPERAARIVALDNHMETRSQVLRDVAEFEPFEQQEYSPAFVLTPSRTTE